MRLGWMELPDRVRTSILGTGLAISGGGFNHCISGVMESIISLGLLTDMLKESRPIYRVRISPRIEVLFYFSDLAFTCTCTHTLTYTHCVLPSLSSSPSPSSSPVLQIQEQCKTLCDVFRTRLPTATLSEPTVSYFIIQPTWLINCILVSLHCKINRVATFCG